MNRLAIAVVAAGLGSGCAEMKDPEFLNALSQVLEATANASSGSASTSSTSQPAYRPPPPQTTQTTHSQSAPPPQTTNSGVAQPPLQTANRPPQTSSPGNRVGASCNWLSAVQYARVVNARHGTRCGKRDSFELDVQNTANQPIKVLVYLLEGNGKWSKNADGTFDAGLKTGAKINHYSCHFGGQYKVVAMPASDFRANRCNYPDYHGY